MGRQTSLSSQQKQQIADLSAQGISQRKIAEQLSISYAAVRNQLEKGVSPSLEQQVEALISTVEVPPPLLSLNSEAEEEYYSDGDIETEGDSSNEEEPIPLKDFIEQSRSRQRASLDRFSSGRGRGRGSRSNSNSSVGGDDLPHATGPQLLAPPYGVFEVRKGLEWLQQQLGQLLEQSKSVYDQLFVLDRMMTLYAKAATELANMHNIEVLDAFIQEVTAILEEQVPESRQRIYRKLEECGLAAGALVVAGNRPTS